MALAAGVAVAGTIPVGQFYITPDPQSFGPIPEGTTQARMLTVVNETSTATNSVQYFITGPSAAQFYFTSPCTGGTGCLGGSVPGMGSADLVITCAPSVMGTHNATLVAMTQIGIDVANTSAELICDATPVGGGTLTVNPNTWDFGSVPVGQTSMAQTFDVHNDTGVSLDLLQVSLTGNGFQFDGPPCFSGQGPCMISPTPPNGSFAPVDVVCRPPAGPTGPLTGSLQANGSGALMGFNGSASLDCFRAAPGTGPEISYTPSSLTFAAPFSTSSTPQSLTIRSEGDAPLDVTIVKVGADCDRFDVTGACVDSGSAPACTLPPTNGLSMVDVVYHPIDVAVVDQCSLQFTTNDPGEGSFLFSISGEGTGGILDVVTVPPLDFGMVPIGIPGSLPISIHNSGNDMLAVDVTASGAPYTVDTPTYTLAPDETHPFWVTCTPTTTGMTPGTFLVDAPAGYGPNTAPLAARCEGVNSPIAFSPPMLDFGRVRIGRSLTLPVAAVNTGTTAVGFAMPSVGAPFTASTTPPPPGQIPPLNQSITVDVTFAPGADGMAMSTVTALIPGEPGRQFLVTGIGTTPAYTVNPDTSMNLGSTCVGDTLTGVFVLTVGGTAILQVQPPAIRNGPAFQVDSFAPMSLPQDFDPDEQVTTTVVATAAAGEARGTLVWTTDLADPDPDETLVELQITGVESGLAASPGAIDFGEVTTGDSVTRPITVEMCAAAPMGVRAAIEGNAAFTLIGAPQATASLTPSEPWSVEFMPPHGGEFSAILRITPETGPDVEIPLTGTDPAPYGATNYYACGCNADTGGFGAAMLLLAMLAGVRRKRR